MVLDICVIMMLGVLYIMGDNNYLKFPSIIREKAERGEFAFPANTKLEYEPFQAYRGIEREQDDKSPVTRSDFMSYAELGKKPRGVDTNSPSYFAASLYLDKACVENALKFPRKGWKIAIGSVYSEAGPTNVNEKTSHVDWWLYAGKEVEGFSIC